MDKRKVTILEPAVREVAHIALYVEGEGMPATAKKFVDDAFEFFDHLSDEALTHRPCKFKEWSQLGYRCANFKKKYIVAYPDNTNEIIICDFSLQKILH